MADPRCPVALARGDVVAPSVAVVAADLDVGVQAAGVEDGDVA